MKGNTPDATPNEPSLRCLSCHDGVTNVDAFGGAAGTTDLDSKFPATTAVIGISLFDDHPVSIGLTGLPAGAQANAEATGLIFYDDGGTAETECLSCHDPHDPTNAPFLRISKNRLCAACHIDKQEAGATADRKHKRDIAPGGAKSEFSVLLRNQPLFFL